MEVAVCGQGRIGKKVSENLTELGYQPHILRIDQERGLFAPDETAIPNTLDLLVICISPAKSQTKWNWGDLLTGMLHQHGQGGLHIKNIIYVSSTVVYDGIESGLVTAAQAPSSNTSRGNKIIQAERALEQIAEHCFILRCSGLIGQGYEKYQEILAQAEDKPRFAVAIKAVISQISELSQQIVTGQQPKSFSAILTDGFVHYYKQKLCFKNDLEQIQALAREHRLLVNSQSN